MKKTDWYPGHVKPARPGHYQRKYYTPGFTEEPDYFDGFLWWGVWRGVREPNPAQDQSREWRGLTEKINYEEREGV